jgi:organic radical activating enzyme
MVDTFCSRSWNNYFVDLEFLTYKMCCKTNWSPMILGEDWFNSKELRERREAHLTGIQHKNCEYCWLMEAKGLKSFRKEIKKPRPTTTFTSKEYSGNVIEIKVGNICNMSCRYCGPESSSIWAERLHDDVYSKKIINSNKSDDQRKLILNQLYEWLDSELKFCNDIVITGGEPTISPQFYDLIDRMNFNDSYIAINTNMNISKIYINKFINTLKKLCINNKVTIRVSLDGADNKNDWQRQGSNWESLKQNYEMIGKLSVFWMISPTVTPLTLEGLVDMAKFIASSADTFYHRPKFDVTAHIVQWPQPLNPVEWIPSFKDEIREFIKITTDADIIKTELTTKLTQWLELPDTLPSFETVISMVKWLDDSQEKWPGIGTWREVYPKLNSIVNQVLSTTK